MDRLNGLTILTIRRKIKITPHDVIYNISEKLGKWDLVFIIVIMA